VRTTRTAFVVGTDSTVDSLMVPKAYAGHASSARIRVDAALRMGGHVRRPHAPLPRRGVGRSVAGRAPPVRDADAGGRAGWPVVVDDPPQARRLPARVRRLRPGGRGCVRTR